MSSSQEDKENPKIQQSVPDGVDICTEKINCKRKSCNKEVLKSKIIMHIKRNKLCKKEYGNELHSMEQEQQRQRQEYLRKYQQMNKNAVRKKSAKYYQTNTETILDKRKEKRRTEQDKSEPNRKRNHNDEKAPKPKKLCDSEEDSDKLAEQQFHERREREKLYKKKWYKENSERIKKSYDPAERKESYKLKKLVKAKLMERICSEKSHEELKDDDDVCKFLDKDKKEETYKKEWYQKNSEKIKKERKECYDPAKRKEIYEQKKLNKEKMIKKICEKSYEELKDDKEVCKFAHKNKKEVTYKKEWYQKNKETILKRRKENYDPSKKTKVYQKYKEKLEKENQESWNQHFEKERIKSNKKFESDARNKNRVEWDYAKRLICPFCKGCKNIKDRNLPEVEEKIKEIKRNADELYKDFEFEIDRIVEQGKDLIAKDSYKTLFMKLYLFYPPSIGSKLA